MDFGSKEFTVVEMDPTLQERLLQGSKKNGKKRSLWKRMFVVKQRSSSRTVVTTVSSTERTSGPHDGARESSVVEEDDSGSEFCLDKAPSRTAAFEAAAALSSAGVENQVPTEINVEHPRMCGCLVAQVWEHLNPDDGIDENEVSDEDINTTTDDQTALNRSHLSTKDVLRSANEAVSNGELSLGLDCYEEILSRLTSDDAALASDVLFACSRLCLRLQDPQRAVSYARRELDQCEEGDWSAISACYSELARLCQFGLGDAQQALDYYKQALEALQSRDIGKDKRSSENDFKARIRDTKECIGRIQFQLGNVDEALRML